MGANRLRRVNVTGDLSGEYVVIEERPDGSLVLAPERPDDPPGRAVSAGGATGSLARLLGRSRERTARSVPELLAGWGVLLRGEEAVQEFLPAEVDGKTGFLAITTSRFIFVSHGTTRSQVTHDYLLSAARNVELARRGMRAQLRVSWHGTDSVISGLGRGELERVEGYLSQG